ncbi:MAG: hypothetical protein H7174_10660 [Flavobacterium sp.]|nr:hypothetical protein [Flavobacterium sp.]
MRQLIYVLFIGIIMSLSSCRKDFSTVASSGNLEFSKTKVYLDTVFSNIGSSTYSLKVYNRSDDDIKIPTIQLGKGMNSKYRIMVDGMSGNNKIFNNVELLAKDSLYIFIETTANIADANAVDLTYYDQILFDNGGSQQAVDLITLIQDCNFIFPNRSLDKKIYEKIAVQGFDPETTGHVLTSSELNWTNAKPYVIYGNCVVRNNTKLTIGAGTSVHFHNNATLIVEDGATLDIQGSTNVFDPANGKVITKNEVTFEGDRLEPEYEDVPGQWGAVILLSGANNIVKNLTLKNAIVGFLMQRTSEQTIPLLTFKDTQIYNCSFYGILARQSVVNARNLVINYAGQSCFAGTSGGNYDFTHCTFNNDWNSNKQLAVYIDNFEPDNNGKAKQTFVLDAVFKNCIIYGRNNIELFLDNQTIQGQAVTNWNANFDKCLIKFNDVNNKFTQIEYAQIKGSNNYQNQNPYFVNSDKNNLRIPNNSFAKGKGATVTLPFKDILNNDRLNPPDIGAYNANP